VFCFITLPGEPRLEEKNEEKKFVMQPTFQTRIVEDRTWPNVTKPKPSVVAAVK